MALADWQLVLVGAAAGMVPALATQRLQEGREVRAERRLLERSDLDQASDLLATYLGALAHHMWGIDQVRTVMAFDRDLDLSGADDAQTEFYRSQHRLMLMTDPSTATLVDRQDDEVKKLYLMAAERSTTTEEFERQWEAVQDLTLELLNLGRTRRGLAPLPEAG